MVYPRSNWHLFQGAKLLYLLQLIVPTLCTYNGLTSPGQAFSYAWKPPFGDEHPVKDIPLYTQQKFSLSQFNLSEL